jgi:hypothetical protein
MTEDLREVMRLLEQMDYRLEQIERRLDEARQREVDAEARRADEVLIRNRIERQAFIERVRRFGAAGAG